MFRDSLRQIVQRRNLTEEETSELMAEIFSGTLSDTLIGAFMAALATKGETFEELAGAAKAMRRKAARIQAGGGLVVDTCGTGGDGTGTFNISTVTAFVVAGCGVTVARVSVATSVAGDNPDDIIRIGRKAGHEGVPYRFAGNWAELDYVGGTFQAPLHRPGRKTRSCVACG